MSYGESMKRAEQEAQQAMQADRFEELILQAVSVGKETERNERLMRFWREIKQITTDLRLEGEERVQFDSFADYVHDMHGQRHRENGNRDFELGAQIFHRRAAEEGARKARILELEDEMQKLDMESREEMGHDGDREQRMIDIADELNLLRDERESESTFSPSLQA